MRDLPTGTVTFLFTDIEGSTRLLHDLGEQYAEALAEHRRVLREAFRARGGVEVDTQGDAFFYVFARAADALAAATAAQDALAPSPIRVRIGVHTGEPQLTDEGYVGLDVHVGARVAACAHGGQVVLSKRTEELVGHGFALRDLGEHRLKDLGDPIWLYQLGDVSFPPLKTLSNTNLPSPASSFVGREPEFDEAQTLLRRTRLLTISGPGGTGKTRFAIELASRQLHDFPNGTFWVPLAALREPALVLEQAAQVVGAKDGLATHVASRKMLLLFDNFEQVVEAAPDLAELLRSCSNLSLLVTSRETLRVEGETEYVLPPLAEEEGVALFCVRTRVEPSTAIRELCLRLDGLPLAIELAAARAKLLSPEQLLGRLSKRLDVLKGGRDVDSRHATLRATIAWSYELLTEDERRLFAHLAVFAGGCTLEAAEQVCAADLDALQSLLDKSLLRRMDERYWMLETIREFATDELEASGHADDLRRRHAAFFLALAESANLAADSQGEERRELAVAEQHNLRAALAWCVQAEPEVGLRMAVALEMFWVVQNPIEGMRWLDALLATDAPLALRARALRAYGSCANPAGDDALAERYYERSLAAFETLGDESGVAHLLMRLGHSAFYRRDLTRARELAARSLAISRGAGDQTEALGLGLAGEVEYALGNHAPGAELVDESASLAGEIGFKWQRTRMLRRLADWALERGELNDAARAVRESLRLSHELADRMAVIFALARLARIAAESGQPERAGRLWGAVEAEEERGSLGAWHVERDKFAAHVLSHTGHEFERARREGRELALAEAVEHALRS